MNSALTVTQLNTYVRSVLDQDTNLADVFIVGEISNFTNHYRTGHFYLSLKDNDSLIKAVMFKSSAAKIKFLPENGMSVLCRGRVSLFERDGQYQLYIDDMQPFGEGALNIAFEQLKEKLNKEGLFDPDHKMPLPEMPMNIAVVTSPTGAALQDIINVLSRRFPLCNVTVFPVQVQGEHAAKQMIKSLSVINDLDNIDLVIIGRGGGSQEDLWAFNDDNLARAIYNFSKPIISAVGHETDFTICDYVCDLRAPTPSAAAELAVPQIEQINQFIAGSKFYLKDCLKKILESKKQKLRIITESAYFKNPGLLIDSEIQKVDLQAQKLKMNIDKILSDNKSKFSSLSGNLTAFSPLAVLHRGYSITSKNGNTITNADDLSKDDLVKITFSKGEVNAKIL